jgi:NADPH-dependent curcumin reductase CurA
MSRQLNRRFRLRRRPDGAVGEGDLELVEESVPSVGLGQALIRTLWLSIDPANRIWMSPVDYGLPPVAIDGVMRGLGIGQVLESRRQDMHPGDLVSGPTGWQDYALADDSANEVPFTVVTSPPSASLPALLAPLGNPGITAYLGLHDIGKPQPGETLVVSAAAGAVGSIAGQIGKARGARVVGIAGSEPKCRHVVEDLGFDACINYKDAGWRERFDAATPDGVDVDFENVGGPVMDHVLSRLNVGARVALCGLMSEYNAATPHIDASRILIRRALMQSFLVLDHSDRYQEAIDYLSGLMADGKLKHRETVIEGLEHARDALNQMFEGANIGKLLVKVAERSDHGLPAPGSCGQAGMPIHADD